MVKPVKKAKEKPQKPTVSFGNDQVSTKKKKGKYDITVKTSLSADDLFKLAINTPIKKKK